jgi:hypothetical protein
MKRDTIYNFFVSLIVGLLTIYFVYNKISSKGYVIIISVITYITVLPLVKKHLQKNRDTIYNFFVSLIVGLLTIYLIYNKISSKGYVIIISVITYITVLLLVKHLQKNKVNRQSNVE